MMDFLLLSHSLLEFASGGVSDSLAASSDHRAPFVDLVLPGSQHCIYFRDPTKKFHEKPPPKPIGWKLHDDNFRELVLTEFRRVVVAAGRPPTLEEIQQIVGNVGARAGKPRGRPKFKGIANDDPMVWQLYCYERERRLTFDDEDRTQTSKAIFRIRRQLKRRAAWLSSKHLAPTDKDGNVVQRWPK